MDEDLEKSILEFKTHQDYYIEPEAIKKNFIYLKDQIKPILKNYREELDFKNKSFPMQLSQDGSRYIIRVELQTPQDTDTQVLQDCIEEIKYCIVNNGKSLYSCNTSNTFPDRLISQRQERKYPQ